MELVKGKELKEISDDKFFVKLKYEILEQRCNLTNFRKKLLTYWPSKTSQTFSVIGNTLTKSSHHNFTHVFGNFVFWNNIFIGQNISQETVIERNVKKL